jgi:hypothetical protein
MDNVKDKLYSVEESVIKRIEETVYNMTDKLNEFERKRNYDMICDIMKMGCKLTIEEMYNQFNIE